jgi:hypothetical protein
VLATARALSTIPRAVGFLHVGRALAIRRLDPGDSARRLLANDPLAKSVGLSGERAAMHQVWPAVGDYERRRANLWALAQSGRVTR